MPEKTITGQPFAFSRSTCIPFPAFTSEFVFSPNPASLGPLHRANFSAHSAYSLVLLHFDTTMRSARRSDRSVSLLFPAGNKYCCFKISSGVRSTMSTSRSIYLCWNPSSSTMLSAPYSSISLFAPSTRSSSTATVTPLRLLANSTGSSPASSTPATFLFPSETMTYPLDFLP